MHLKAATRILLVGSLLMAAACGGDDARPPAGSGEDATEEADAPTGCGADGEIALDVSGDFGTFGPQFSPGCLVAPADEPFEITFENVDDGVIHNLAVLVESGGEELGATKLAKGPTTQTLALDPLDAGQYVFVCEKHPRLMKGTLAVVDAGE